MLEKYTHNKFIFWVCKSLFILYIGITLFMTHMTSDLVSKIFLTLVSKIFQFIFVILYRPTLLTIRFDDFDDLTILFDWIPFYAAYLFFSILNCCVHWGLSSLSQGNEMNRMNVTCVALLFLVILMFPWTFNIVYISMSLLHPMISWL